MWFKAHNTRLVLCAGFQILRAPKFQTSAVTTHEARPAPPLPYNHRVACETSFEASALEVTSWLQVRSRSCSSCGATSERFRTSRRRASCFGKTAVLLPTADTASLISHAGGRNGSTQGSRKYAALLNRLLSASTLDPRRGSS